MQQDDLYSSEYYKLGFLYFNTQNSKLFVPKRFGLGWTINFGRIEAWIIILALICFIIIEKFFIK